MNQTLFLSYSNYVHPIQHLSYLNTFDGKDLGDSGFQKTLMILEHIWTKRSGISKFMSGSVRRHICLHPLRCVSDQIYFVHFTFSSCTFYLVHFTISSCTLLHTTAMSRTVKIIFAKDGRWQLALFISQFYTDRDAKYINYKHSRINLSRQMFPLWRHLMWLVGRVILFLTSWYVSLGYTSTIQSNVLPTISNLSSNFLVIAKWQKLEGKKFLLQNNLSFGFSPFYSWSLRGAIL